MSCDVGKTAEGFENELWRRWSEVRVTAHSSTLPSLYLRHSSFYSPHSPTLTSLHLCHSSFSNPSAALPTSQLILQPSFSNPYFTSPTSQLILQPFRRITYVTAHCTALPLLHLRHRHFTNVMPLWWCLIYPWWFCNLQWLRPARLYERCKLALAHKRLKTSGVDVMLKTEKWRIWKANEVMSRKQGLV